MSNGEPSAVNGTSDRQRISALEADVQALTAVVEGISTRTAEDAADVQALTTLVEGFSTRTAQDAAKHWELSGELKARLDYQDRILQTLVGRSEDHSQMLQTHAQMLQTHAQMLQTIVGRSEDHSQMLQTLVGRSEDHSQMLQTLVDRSEVQQAPEPELRQ